MMQWCDKKKSTKNEKSFSLHN